MILTGYTALPFANSEGSINPRSLLSIVVLVSNTFTCNMGSSLKITNQLDVLVSTIANLR